MKFEVRLEIVKFAEQHGIKPATREFDTTVNTVRKWLRRWQANNHARASLVDLSRAPKTCPHKTSPKMEKMIIRIRKKAPCLGPERLKDFFALPVSQGAIARILKQNGLTKKRKKKYEKKRDLREVKARFQPFEENQVDVKYLNDIPFYVEQLLNNSELPKFEYTWRDVKTGCVFLGFSNELSEAAACCFAAAVGGHIRRTGFDFSTVQTDNGAEFSGMERKTKKDRGFHNLIEQKLKAKHRFIPPGKKNRQADVESLHERIESEFFDLEKFSSRSDFFNLASAWQLWWNTTRKNRYKGKRSPEDILKESCADRNFKVWLLPALDLDVLLSKRAEKSLYNPLLFRGYHVPALPAAGGLTLQRLHSNTYICG
jgi:transposase-like protein